MTEVITDPALLQRVSYLINNKRKFATARKELDDFVKASADLQKVSAHIWFQLALTSRLLKKPRWDIEAYERRAQEAPDFTPAMYEDLMRDSTLDAIRRSDLDGVMHTIGNIWNYRGRMRTNTDKNREAVLTMVEARYWLAKKDFLRALAVSRVAFMKLPNVNRNAQWQYNIQFTWLHAAAAWGDMDSVLPWYPDWIREEPSRKRRALGRLLRYGGRFGAALTRLVFKG